MRNAHVQIASLLGLLAACAGSALAAGPYPLNQCVGTRSGSLGCSANDVVVAQVQVTNGVTGCVAGSTVNVGLRLFLQSNASSRYDIGVFVARDAKPPELPSSAGGSTDCAVFAVPTGPPPLADLDGNACGDLTSTPTPAVVDLGVVSLLCVPDQNGRIKVPATITWQQNANNACFPPAAAWVEAGSPSKCNASAGIDVPVEVSGTLTITKRTLPAGQAGTFSYTATGATPAAFTLADGQQQVLTIPGPLTATAIPVTVTESLAPGFDPSADLSCLGVDGGPAIMTLDPATRTITVPFDFRQTRVTCTVVNKVQSRISIVKAAIGGDGAFPFTGTQDFTITTAGGSGQRLVAGLGAGFYDVTEIVPAGWSLAGIACVDPSGGTTTNLPGKSARVDLAAGELVTCTFTNTLVAPATGTINIVKTTSGGDGAFLFSTLGAGLGAFALQTSGGTSPTKSFTGLAAGAYSATELASPGWNLASITCVDPSGNSNGAGATASIDLAAGETVTCTFANTRPASVIIEKVAVGGDAAFAFTGTAAFAIATSSGFGRDAATFASVAGGSTITFNETVPAGWAFVGATCRDDGSGVPVGVPAVNGRTLTVAAGQQITCTVTNQRLAELTVIEISTPKSAQAFAYSTTGPGLANFSLADDGSGTNTRIFTALAPGQAYNITQVAVAGWQTPLIACSDRFAASVADRTAISLATRTIQPNLQPGERLVCTFVNVQTTPGAIAITKAATGGDDAFALANTGGVLGSPTNPLAFTITTAAGSGSRHLTGLVPGLYTITEAIPAGWLAPAQVDCSVVSGSSTTITPVANGASIALGQTGLSVDSVSCAFLNVREARLTVVENATPDSAQSFAYSATGAGLPAGFALVNDGSAPPADRISFGGLAAGDFGLASVVPPGWRLPLLGCTGASVSTANLAAARVDLSLSPGDDATCTFLHFQESTITVTKAAPGAQPGDTFTFQAPAGLDGAYAAGDTRTINVLPGVHTVTEAVPEGWTLANINCVGGAVAYSGATIAPTNGFEAGDHTANITLGAGQSSACTFSNNPAASTIVVRKQTVGGQGVFAFTGAADFQIDTRAGLLADRVLTLPAGVHAITEVVPPGWRLTGIACTGSSAIDLAAATATVTLAAGERVRCTFTDEKLGRLVIVKALRGEATAIFPFVAPVSLVPGGVFLLAPPIATGSATRVFENVPPGNYLVGETSPPAGFRLATIDCVDPTGDSVPNTPANEALARVAPGETVTCTWTNATVGSITITAVSIGGLATFAFNLTGFISGQVVLPTSPLALETGAAQTTFGGLGPSLYTITPQPPPAGWTYRYTECVSSSREQRWLFIGGTTDIVLPDGEAVSCFFFFTAAAAGAGGGIVSIPTLSPAMLALLAVLLAAAGWRGSRPRR